MQVCDGKFSPVRILIRIQFVFTIVSPIMLELPKVQIEQTLMKCGRNLLTRVPRNPIRLTLLRTFSRTGERRLVDLTISENFLVKLFGSKSANFFYNVCKSPVTMLSLIEDICKRVELLVPHQLGYHQARNRLSSSCLCINAATEGLIRRYPACIRFTSDNAGSELKQLLIPGHRKIICTAFV